MMPFKAQVNRALLLFGACYSSIAGAQWNSYVDSNSNTEITYGYMEGPSTSKLSSKLKLVCLSPRVLHFISITESQAIHRYQT